MENCLTARNCYIVGKPGSIIDYPFALCECEQHSFVSASPVAAPVALIDYLHIVLNLPELEGDGLIISEVISEGSWHSDDQAFG